MATSSVMTMGVVPSVHRPLNQVDLYLSSTTATSLPRIKADLMAPDEDLKALVGMIVDHNMVGKLAVHLLHSHEPLKPGEVKLENKLETVPGTWMRPVPAASLDPSSIHGIAFKIELKNETLCLIPYEFAKGPSPVAKDDKTVLDFMTELANYIIQRGLTDVFALQFVELGGLAAIPTAEIEVGGLGTITLPQSMQKIGRLVPVSWPNPADPTAHPDGPGPGEHWNEATKSDGTKTHKVHVDNAKTEEGVLESLAKMGIFCPDKR
ncbi:hypothetical protein BKA61DRAFT_675935 [Leptodontidium sp. MPI-SDFR-AT-0119]|nr:hypothetical protein BKA61DRAFT_675935 [Leptodontidium sp. MPI-SDFR-AT-0119]